MASQIWRSVDSGADLRDLARLLGVRTRPSGPGPRAATFARPRPTARQVGEARPARPVIARQYS